MVTLKEIFDQLSNGPHILPARVGGPLEHVAAGEVRELGLLPRVDGVALPPPHLGTDSCRRNTSMCR